MNANIKVNDSCKITGEFVLRIIDAKSNAIIQEIKEKNLFVDSGKLNISKLLGGDTTNGKPIDTIGVGTSNTAAAAGDTALTSSFTRGMNGNSTYAAVTYPSNTQVRFAYTIGTGEANGKTIWEFGLLNTNSALCARKVLSTSIAKTSSIALEGEWTLKIN